MKKVQFEGLLEGLPFKFSDTALLERVFIHRSFLNEKESKRIKEPESNERLEFLGDAVLSNVISHMLYLKFPEAEEGELTRLRARLVNKHALSRMARELGLNEHLLLGKGERSSGGAENLTILAGVFEALIAAVYIEFGYGTAASYIEGIFSPLMDSSLLEAGHFDHKPKLQELTQKFFKEQPVYRLIREDGPPHKKVFEIEVVVTGMVLGCGSAARKKDAEQSAAGEALKSLRLKYKELFDPAVEDCPVKNNS